MKKQVKLVEKQDMKTIIDKIYLTLLCIIIAMLNLFIGSNHQEPKTILETIILLIGISFIIIKTIQKEKNIIIKGKIDIFVTLLIIATFIPLINQNYYSLNDTINLALEYVCVYVIYILARNLLKTKKEINIVIDTLLISSIVIIIFGLDKLYFNIFSNFLKLINSRKSNAYGMISTFGYSNPLAAYMSLLSFIALGRYLCVENKWIKALFSSYIQIAFIGFVFGNSRALMIMYPIIFIIYLIVLKDNQKRIQSIAIICSNFVIAYVFQAICNKFITTNLMLWISFALDLVLAYFLSLVINKVTAKIKINKKKLLITIVTIIILLAIYCLAVIDIEEPIKMDKNDGFIEILGLKNNEQYNIKINVSTNFVNTNSNNSEEDKQVKLQLVHYSSKRSKRVLGERVLQRGEQNLEFNVQTREDFERFRIYVKNLYSKQIKITINHIYVNGKEYIAEYKYLPNDVIRMIRTLNFRTVSVYERIAFCKDSLKLAQNHLIFGAGGNAFENHITPYQSYVHGYNRESHSYILDLLLNYGIFGLLIYIAILITTIYNVYKKIKNSRKENKENNIALYIAVLFGIMLFTVHAVIDYDLNYLVTICMFYMLIAILNKENEENEKIENTKESKLNLKNMLYNLVVTILLILCLTLTIPRCYADHLVKQKEYKKAYSYCKYSENIKLEMLRKAHNTKNIEELGELLEIYIRDEKYKNNLQVYNYLNDIILYYLDNTDYEKTLKYLEIFYKYITENDNISRVDTSEIYAKKDKINSLLKNIEKSNGIKNQQIVEWYNKFKELKI